MNILLINHYAGSPKMGMEFRPYYFAKEWIKSGHNVTILAADNSHLRKKEIKINKSFTKEIIDGINYIWVKTPKYSGNGISRVRNIFSFVLKTYFKSKSLSKSLKPDVVIASSTYTIDNYVARKIAKLNNAKHIYEVHDLWPLSPMELGNMSKYHPFIMIMQHGENFAYKKCDIAISMLPNTKQHMQTHGLELSKWHYIPNGIVIEDWNNPEDIPTDLDSRFKSLKEQNKFIVGYTGGHAISNSLHTLIDSAEILKNNEEIVFVLVGNGSEKESLMRKAKNFSNVIFINSIPKKAIPNVLKYMDVVTVGAIQSNLYQFGVSPNKMIDYMIAGKPIIQYINSGYDIIKMSDTGISIEPENPVALADAILKIKEMTVERLENIKTNGRNFVLENHEYKRLSKKFIEIINH